MKTIRRIEGGAEQQAGSDGEIRAEIRSRSVGWVVGTSVGGFEVVVLGLAAWIFCRRDY